LAPLCGELVEKSPHTSHIHVAKVQQKAPDFIASTYQC
jgi:hypothetical protein